MTTPYALGFTTQEKEVSTRSLPIRGDLPSWLKGRLVRTGPARFEVGAQHYRHWFDGLGMLYSFAFEDGQVHFQNRFLRGTSFLESMARGEIRRDGFATQRKRSWLERLMPLSKLKPGDNCNVSIVKNGTDFLALTETPTPLAFDANTLETLGACPYEGELFGQVSTAHPHFDQRRNCYYNYVVEFGRSSRYHFYSLANGSRRRQRLASIPVEQPAYMHSFAATENYLVLVEFPLVTKALRFVLNKQPFIEKYRWQPERGTVFHVVDKESGRLVASRQAEAFFAFHHINAFEQGKDLVLDIATYPDAAVVKQLYLDELLAPSNDLALARPLRCIVPLEGAGDVRQEFLGQDRFDFPRVNEERHLGKAYRYVYGAGQKSRGILVDQLVKLDVQGHSSRVWHEEACFPGEPVFVNAPTAKREDEGVILSVVLDANQGLSFLLILDAETFDERARVSLPLHLPFGFHGNFYSA